MDQASKRWWNSSSSLSTTSLHVVHSSQLQMRSLLPLQTYSSTTCIYSKCLSLDYSCFHIEISITSTYPRSGQFNHATETILTYLRTYSQGKLIRAAQFAVYFRQTTLAMGTQVCMYIHAFMVRTYIQLPSVLIVNGSSSQPLTIRTRLQWI